MPKTEAELAASEGELRDRVVQLEAQLDAARLTLREAEARLGQAHAQIGKMRESACLHMRQMERVVKALHGHIDDCLGTWSAQLIEVEIARVLPAETIQAFREELEARRPPGVAGEDRGTVEVSGSRP